MIEIIYKNGNQIQLVYDKDDSIEYWSSYEDITINDAKVFIGNMHLIQKDLKYCNFIKLIKNYSLDELDLVIYNIAKESSSNEAYRFFAIRCMLLAACDENNDIDMRNKYLRAACKLVDRIYGILNAKIAMVKLDSNLIENFDINNIVELYKSDYNNAVENFNFEGNIGDTIKLIKECKRDSDGINGFQPQTLDILTTSTLTNFRFSQVGVYTDIFMKKYTTREGVKDACESDFK